MKHLTLLLCLFLPAFLAAQCDYDQLFREGKTFQRQRQYKQALYKFNSARRCDPNKGEKVDAAIEALLDQVEGEKKAVDRERERAENEKMAANMERERAENEKMVADREREKAQKERQRAEAVLDKIYFYANSFGLAYDKTSGRYGFIDKQLNTKIKFNYWGALPFDFIGYANVKYADQEYLIDTVGTEFKLANDLYQLSSTVEALDLRGKNLDNIPEIVLNQTQLKVLLLAGNQFTYLPEQIGELKSLESLDLARNQLKLLPEPIGDLSNLQSLYLLGNRLTVLPERIGDLRSLQWLDLSENRLKVLPDQIKELNKLQGIRLTGNPFSARYITQLRTSMPWCKIEF